MRKLCIILFNSFYTHITYYSYDVYYNEILVGTLIYKTQ